MVSFSVDDIFAKEWQELDFLLEDVEKGRKKESVLIENETFLHMLAAVKSNVSEYMKIPSFIRGSKICQKYCRRYNSTVIQFFADPNASIIITLFYYLNGKLLLFLKMIFFKIGRLVFLSLILFKGKFFLHISTSLKLTTDYTHLADTKYDTSSYTFFTLHPLK